MVDETLLRIKQAAILLNVHPISVRRYIREGKLQAVKISGSVRIPRKSIDNFIQDIYPTHYGAKKITKNEQNNLFTLEDPLFRVKGRGISLKTNF